MSIQEPSSVVRQHIEIMTRKAEEAKKILSEIDIVQQAVTQSKETNQNRVILTPQMNARLKQCHTGALSTLQYFQRAEKEGDSPIADVQRILEASRETITAIQTKIEELPQEAEEAPEEEHRESSAGRRERDTVITVAPANQGQEGGHPQALTPPGASTEPRPAKRRRIMEHPAVRTAMERPAVRTGAAGGATLLAGAARTGFGTLWRYPYAAGVGTAINWAPAAIAAGAIAHRAPGWTRRQRIAAGVVGLGTGTVCVFTFGAIAPEVAAATTLGSALAAGELFRPRTNQPPDVEQGTPPAPKK